MYFCPIKLESHDIESWAGAALVGDKIEMGLPILIVPELLGVEAVSDRLLVRCRIEDDMACYRERIGIKLEQSEFR